MKTDIELLEILLNSIIDLKDGEQFIFVDKKYHTNKVNGLCGMIRHLFLENIITDNQKISLNNILEININEDFSEKYPITYYLSKFGTKDSSYFFEECNWSIRRNWLIELINIQKTL